MNDNVPEVKVVLEEFFILEVGKGWTNPRADQEIEKYQSKVQSAIRAGKASALARSNASSTMVQPNKKQETLNKKQETNIKRPRNVSKKTWDDFLTHRKNKKAPLTETALIGIKNEVKKTTISLEDALVMCQARGWQSFKSDWINKEQKSFATTNYGEGVQKI
jgi:sarcosine oxidase delta subunit